MKKRATFTALLAALLMLAAFPCQAFKIDTHVWVAQQVLNDVSDDGKVTIPPYGSFTVNPDLANALRQYPDEFRMGSIGPDGFPDLLGGQQTVHPGVPGGWKTDQWLEWVLKKARTPRQRAFAYGYLNHAATDTFAHTYVNTYAGDIFNLADEQEVEIRHMALEELIKVHMPPLRDNAGRRLQPYAVLGTPAAFLADTLILNPTVADQYRQQGATRYLALMYDHWSGIQRVSDKIEAIKQEANNRIEALQQEISDLEDRIHDLKNMKVTIHGYTVNLYPGYCFLDPGTCLLILSLDLTLKGVEKSLEVPKGINALANDALQKPVDAWRNEIREAIKQYMLASEKVAAELMKQDGDPALAFREWLCEWAPVFIGVPNELSWPTCTVNSGIARATKLLDDVNKGINRFRGEVAGRLGAAAWAVDPAYQIQQLIDNEIRDLGIQLAAEILATLAGNNSLAIDLLMLRLEKHTDAKVTSIFSADASNKGLLLIPDVVERVHREMSLNGNGHFDPQSYPVIYNAIILSKLVMLDASQLNLIAKRAGIDDTIYGADLYDPAFFSNILVGSIASIDGNHQWQEFPPDYPRRSNAQDNGMADMAYGYPFTSQDPARRGFRFWQDCEARDLVFRKIFRGPLAAGVELPSLLGLSPVSDYANPMSVSEADPFPLADRSRLALKVLTDDPAFAPSSWLQTGNLSRLFDFTRYPGLEATALAPVNLPPSKYSRESQPDLFLSEASPELLVLPLSAQACGGNRAKGLTAKWSFKADCVYRCECARRFLYDPRTGVYDSFVACSCSSAQCGALPLITAQRQTLKYGMGPFLDQGCEMCHGGPGSNELTEGSYLISSKYAPGIKLPDSNGVEFGGALICDPSALQTKLIMKPVDTKNINLVMTDTATGERAAATTTKQTNYPGMETLYADWREVDAAILRNNGKNSACGIAPPVYEPFFEADVTAPALSAPDDVSLSCASLNSMLADGATVADVIGAARVTDNRDPDLVASNDAPARLSSGSITVNWSVTDKAGNTTSASQQISILDQAAPVFPASLPTITVTAMNPAGTSVNPTPPVAVDDCDGNIQASTQTDLSRIPIGESTITWVAQDSMGNTATASQRVVVRILPGDLNIDGKIDSADLRQLAASLGETPANETALRDYDQDGDIDQDDQAIFELAGNTRTDLRDINNDQKIDEQDARQLVAAMENASGDADGDGIHDAADNCILQANADQADPDGDGFGSVCDPDGERATAAPQNSGGGGGGAFGSGELCMLMGCLLLFRGRLSRKQALPGTG